MHIQDAEVGVIWGFFLILLKVSFTVQGSGIKSKKTNALPPDLPMSTLRNDSVELRLDV